MSGLISQDLADKLGANVEPLEELIQIILQEALKMLPLVNENLIKRSAVLHKLSEEFYSKNSDLAPHKPIVAQAIEKLEGKNPGMGFEKLLAQAGIDARETIGLTKTFSSNGVIPTKRNLEQLDLSIGEL